MVSKLYTIPKGTFFILREMCKVLRAKTYKIQDELYQVDFLSEEDWAVFELTRMGVDIGAYAEEAVKQLPELERMEKESGE